MSNLSIIHKFPFRRVHVLVQEVASHLGLDSKTVREIDRKFLEEAYEQTDYQGLRILVVDEISICKGQCYPTVVLD